MTGNHSQIEGAEAQVMGDRTIQKEYPSDLPEKGGTGSAFRANAFRALGSVADRFLHLKKWTSSIRSENIRA